MKIARIFYSITLIIGVVSLASCTKDNCIHGSGPIITQELDIVDFNGFDLGGSFNIVLEQDSVIKVVAQSQQNIIDAISTNVNNGIWDATFYDGCYNDYDLTVFISHPSITDFGISGSGSIHIIDLYASIENLDMFISGSGSIFCNDSLLIDNNINTTISGSGNVFLGGGSAPNQNITISGSGNYLSFEFLSDSCLVSIPGSGNVEVNVDSTLEVSIGGSGSVYYKGYPTITSNISGSGEIVNSN